MSDVRLVLDGARMAELLRSPTGIVGIHLIEKGEIVKQGARARAPVGVGTPHPGCLRDTILKRVIEDAEHGFAVMVISDTTPCSEDRISYSLFVHEGTVPHDIPNAFGYGPTFGIGGRFSGHFHPGNKPNPFLRDALALIAI